MRTTVRQPSRVREYRADWLLWGLPAQLGLAAGSDLSDESAPLRATRPVTLPLMRKAAA